MIIAGHFLTCYQDYVVVDGRVVDLDTFEVIVGGVIPLNHVLGDVRNVLSRVTLARDVDIEAFHAEGIYEVLPEAIEVIANVNLIVDSNVSWRETDADRLINPDIVGQIRVGIRVRGWLVSAWLPKHRTVF